jgi:nucleotide-binding universal stress UspA family protein
MPYNVVKRGRYPPSNDLRKPPDSPTAAKLGRQRQCDKAAWRARPGAAPRALKSGEIRFNRILVPIDFSRKSRTAIRYALTLASHFAATIHLIHVVEPMNCAADFGYGQVIQCLPDTDLRCKCKRKLKSLAEKIVGRRFPWEAIILNGTPERVIIEAAKSLGANLIVMPTPAHSIPENAARESMAEYTIRHASCPVLVF